MIVIQNTPNNLGVAICGDHGDFDHLYDALHEIVGVEGEFSRYGAARLRVLGFCYDLRHACQGDREIELVDNGMDKQIMKMRSLIVPETNVYLKINALWPEMLFITMALNDFVRLHAAKNAGKSYNILFHKQNIWNRPLAAVRSFQAAVMDCVKELVAGPSFSRMLNLMVKDYTWFDDYASQYIDVLNGRFVAMDPDKRLKNIPLLAKRLGERSDEYTQLKNEVMAAAREHRTRPENIEVSVDIPDTLDW